MPAGKPAALVLAAILALVTWTAQGSGRPAPRSTPLAAQGPNTEQPVAEYREVRSGIAGKTGRLLTIDRSGRATLQP